MDRTQVTTRLIRALEAIADGEYDLAADILDDLIRELERLP